MSALVRVPIVLGTRSYDIVIGPGLLRDAGKLMADAIARPRVFIVSDETVAKLHLPTLTASLDAASIAHTSHIVPPGEASKDHRTLERLPYKL